MKSHSVKIFTAVDCHTCEFIDSVCGFGHEGWDWSYNQVKNFCLNAGGEIPTFKSVAEIQAFEKLKWKENWFFLLKPGYIALKFRNSIGYDLVYMYVGYQRQSVTGKWQYGTISDLPGGFTPNLSSNTGLSCLRMHNFDDWYEDDCSGRNFNENNDQFICKCPLKCNPQEFDWH